MRGIELEFDSSINNYLWRILHNIKVNDYIWHITDQSIYLEWRNEKEFRENNDPLFDKKVLTGMELLRCIDRKYYIMNVTLEAFPIGSQIVKMQNYDDFVNSDCFLFFLCIDRTHVYIYCKDQNVLCNIIVECNGTDILFIKEITNENDNIRFF